MLSYLQESKGLTLFTLFLRGMLGKDNKVSDLVHMHFSEENPKNYGAKWHPVLNMKVKSLNVFARLLLAKI